MAGLSLTQKCPHNRLEAIYPYTSAVDIDFTEVVSGVVGHFMFRKYRCLTCNRVVTVLNAVVSEDGP